MSMHYLKEVDAASDSKINFNRRRGSGPPLPSASIIAKHRRSSASFKHAEKEAAPGSVIAKSIVTAWRTCRRSKGSLCRTR